MKGTLGLRIAGALIVALLGLAYMLPSLPGVSQSGLGSILPDDRINLGLDLKGGIHLTLEVDVNKAIENSLAQIGQDVRSYAREKNIMVLKPHVLSGERLAFTLLRKGQQQNFDSFLGENFSALTVQAAKPLADGKVEYMASLTPDYRKHIIKMTVDQAVKTIRNRIDEFGVAEPDIRKQQGGRIQVQLPGLQDPERAIGIIGKTAHLEFRIVDDSADIQRALKGILPPDRILMTMRTENPDGTFTEAPVVVEKTAVLTGEYITDAKTQFDSWNQPYVSMTFNNSGARLFERITAENVKKRMAIVLDGHIYSAPVIQERIAGGRASISGQFTTDQAHDLAIVLRAGALPAPVKVLEQRTVGPSLGQESIDQGITAALLGTALVLVFMVVYYGFGGLVADVVLTLNIVLIMAGLAAFGATLTLPGIAGIILTIGMAVDANVIIFERIREELRKGLTPRAAIEEGYARATLTILDANVTTIIAAIILYEFGTGPIRGFAVTLSLGILASMFTAIFVSRVLFDIYTSSRPQLQKLSI